MLNMGSTLSRYYVLPRNIITTCHSNLSVETRITIFYQYSKKKFWDSRLQYSRLQYSRFQIATFQIPCFTAYTLFRSLVADFAHIVKSHRSGEEDIMAQFT